jgi:hypothetical protein
VHHTRRKQDIHDNPGSQSNGSSGSACPRNATAASPCFSGDTNTQQGMAACWYIAVVYMYVSRFAALGGHPVTPAPCPAKRTWKSCIAYPTSCCSCTHADSVRPHKQRLHSMPASNTHHMRASTSCAWGRAPQPVCHVKQKHQQRRYGPGGGSKHSKSTVACLSAACPCRHREHAVSDHFTILCHAPAPKLRTS